MCNHAAQCPGFKIQDGDYSFLFDKSENKIVHLYNWETSSPSLTVFPPILAGGDFFFFELKGGDYSR